MPGKIEMRWKISGSRNVPLVQTMNTLGNTVKLQFRYQEEDYSGQSEEPDYKWSEWTDVEIEL